MLLAKDIMRKKVLTVTPEMTLRQVCDLFVRAKITGAPVLGPGRKLQGVISQTDIIRRDQQAARTGVPAFYREGERIAMARPVETPDLSPVREVMTRKVYSVDEKAPITDVGRFLVDKHIHRIMVTQGGKLSGIITATDMVAALLSMVEATRPKRKG